MTTITPVTPAPAPAPVATVPAPTVAIVGINVVITVVNGFTIGIPLTQAQALTLARQLIDLADDTVDAGPVGPNVSDNVPL